MISVIHKKGENVRNKKRIWIRSKRLSDLYREKGRLIVKLTPPSSKTITGVGHIYAKLFKDPHHNINVRDKWRYEKIDSLIHEMKKNILGSSKV